ncbi:MAG: hypothetical protein PHH70_00285 [Candidatus Gracilibacteria bacterium]|nr:hypothetical protein [Candidatus Gracilibacteria bacterium]
MEGQEQFKSDLDELTRVTDGMQDSDTKKTEAKEKLSKLRDDIKSNTSQDANIRTQIDELKKLVGISEKAKATAETLQGQIDVLKSDPDGLEKALKLYNAEKDLSVNTKRSLLSFIAQTCIFGNGMRIDFVRGVTVYTKDGHIDAKATKALESIPRDDLVDISNLLMLQNYRDQKGDTAKIKAEMVQKYNLQLTGDPTNDSYVIENATNIPPEERSWLLNAVINPDSVKLSDAKRRELVPQAEKAADKKAQVAQQLKFTAEDLRNPENAIGKLMSNGGALLVIPGALWLVLSCFGMDTFGKDHFFMKFLATLTGIGAAKAVGLLDFAADAVEGKQGTMGGKTAEKVSSGAVWTWEQMKSAFNVTVNKTDELVKRLNLWYEYSNYTAPNVDGQQKPVAELNFLSLHTRLGSTSRPTFTRRDNPAETLNSGKVEALKNNTDTLYQDGIKKIQQEQGISDAGVAEANMKDIIAQKTVSEVIVWVTTGASKPTVAAPAAAPASSATQAAGASTTPAQSATPAGQVQTSKPLEESV